MYIIKCMRPLNVVKNNPKRKSNRCNFDGWRMSNTKQHALPVVYDVLHFGRFPHQCSVRRLPVDTFPRNTCLPTCLVYLSMFTREIWILYNKYICRIYIIYDAERLVTFWETRRTTMTVAMTFTLAVPSTQRPTGYRCRCSRWGGDIQKSANHGRPANDALMEDKTFIVCETRAASPVPSAPRSQTNLGHGCQTGLFLDKWAIFVPM